MYKYTTGTVLFLIVLNLLLTRPVVAGGWAVVTLDELPSEVRAGQPIEVGFQVMQHGVHPLVLAPGEATVVARHLASGESLAFTAQPDATAGHYTVRLLLPHDGRWSWQIRPGGFPPAEMPELVVAAGLIQPAAQSQPTSNEWSWWQQVTYQLLISLRPPPAPVPAPATVDRTADQAAYGKALFVAKGCMTCHLHRMVNNNFSVQIGPDLSNYKVIPEYVSLWLKDPQSIKPQTQMPQLNLSTAEIDALIAFLSAGQR